MMIIIYLLWQINTGASLLCIKYSFIILSDRSPPVIYVLYNSTNKIILHYFHRQKFKIAVFVCLQARGKKRQKGWFPASHVKLLGSNSGTSTPASAASKKQNSFPGLMFFCVNLSSSLSMYSLKLVGQVIAIYDYTAANEDELSFSKSQVINVLDKSNPDWWKGELNGVTGLIPANYVKMTTSDSDPSQQCK